MHSPSRWSILLTVVAGTFIGALNTSIVNVSIPALMRAFNAELHHVEWVVTSFMIAFSVTMPMTNWLKERLSYRLLFVLSLAVFSFGSLLCGLSNSLELLIVSRVIQAIGGGALGPLSMAIVTDTFPANERGRAFGIWGLGVVIGPAIGPTLGGYLTEVLSWRWIFFVNLPFGLIAMALGWRNLHRKKLEVTHYQKFDLNGFVWITACIVSLLYSLAKMAEQGVSPLSLWLLAGSVFFGYFFVRAEKATDSPLWDLTLFKNRVFVSCILITLVRSISLFGGVFLLPLILQGHMHLSETQSGLVMLPGALILAVMMPVTGSWADKGYTYILTITGLVILAASFIVFVGVEPTTPQWVVVFIQLLRGIGLGFLVTPLSAATMGSVKHSQIAMASSISTLAQQLGGSLGIALLVLLKALFVQFATSQRKSPLDAELFSLHACFLAAGVIVLLSLFPARRVPAPIK
jgi:MFS transporter, DHA2 family, multidrug resistance protein